MAHFDLSVRESGLLADILRSYLSDLRLEIADTEKKEIRDMMKEQKTLIISILERLDGREVDIVESCCREL